MKLVLTVSFVIMLIVAAVNTFTALTPRTLSASQTTAEDRLELITDTDPYIPGQPVYITGHAVTPSITWTYACPEPMRPDCGLAVQISIYRADSNGLVHSGATDAAWGEYKSFFYVWEAPCVTSPNLAFAYRIEASMNFAGKELRGVKLIGLVLPVDGIPASMGVTTDKSRYFPGESVEIEGFLQLPFPTPSDRATVILNVTKGDLLIFEATFTDLRSNSYVLPYCGAEESVHVPAIYFRTAFVVPQNAPTGIYMVNAQAMDVQSPTARARSYLVVDGSWEYTHTMLLLSTTISSITYASELRGTSGTSSTPTSVITAMASTNVILATQTTVTVPEFGDMILPALVGIILVGVILMTRKKARMPR